MVFDEAELSERLSHDAELEAEVIALFIEDCLERLGAIDNALAAGDGLELRAAAHALKGAAGNLSAHHLSAAAGALEHVASASGCASAAGAVARVKSDAGELLPLLRARLAASISVRG